MLESSLDLAFDLPAAAVLAADTAFWQLYDSSFSSREREPHDVILATVHTGAGLVVRARSAGLTIGLTCTHMLCDPPVAFLVYLAVAPALRSRHIGAALFEQARLHSAEHYSSKNLIPAGLVWEVEIPALVASDEREFEQRRRRIAFFERLGGRILPQRYLQPPVDGIAPVLMHLMFRPVPGAPFPDAAATAALIHAIYFEKYRVANGIPRKTLDELLRQTMPA